MLRSSITSSNITEAAWENQTLWLTFTNKAVYAYPGVPISVYNAFLEAPSQGKFFHSYIKQCFPGSVCAAAPDTVQVL